MIDRVAGPACKTAPEQEGADAGCLRRREGESKRCRKFSSGVVWDKEINLGEKADDDSATWTLGFEPGVQVSLWPWHGGARATPRPTRERLLADRGQPDTALC
jgi:hypothetical protein